MTKSRGSRDYIFLRGNVWWIKFRYPADYMPPDPTGITEGLKPSSRRVEKSLGTKDRAEAEILALGLLAAYKKSIWQWRAMLAGTIKRAPRHRQEPGSTIYKDDGSRLCADETTIYHFSADDRLISKPKPNKLNPGAVKSFPIPNRDDRRLIKSAAGSRKKDDINERILAKWREVRQCRKPIWDDAEDAYDLWTEFTDAKSFLQATPQDVKRFATHLHAELKAGSIVKKIGHFRAAYYVAQEYSDEFPPLKANPFATSLPLRDDATLRKMLNDDDMLTIHADLHNWTRDERVLFLLCAGLGIRRGEAWHIKAEETIMGHRCVYLGTKTASSRRWVILYPELVAALGTELPAKITGPLFAPDVQPLHVGRSILRRMRGLGITDEGKVIHSLRYRASTRMGGYQDSLRDAVLGHADSGRGTRKTNAPKRYFGGHHPDVVASAMVSIGVGAPGTSPTVVMPQPEMPVAA